MGYDEISWSSESRLKEMDFGSSAIDMAAAALTPEYRTLEWKAAEDGESRTDVAKRLTPFFSEVDTKHPDEAILFVYHGNALQVTRYLREGFSEDAFAELFEKPYKYYTNCQLIIYSDTNPKTNQVEKGRVWVLSVCPWDITHCGHDWIEISENYRNNPSS